MTEIPSLSVSSLQLLSIQFLEYFIIWGFGPNLKIWGLFGNTKIFGSYLEISKILGFI